MSQSQKSKKTSAVSETSATSSSNRIPAKIVPDDPMFIPMYKTPGSSCCDLVANIPPDCNGKQEVRLLPGRIEIIDCGFSMTLEPGWEAQIRSSDQLLPEGVEASIQIIDDGSERCRILIRNIGKSIIVLKHGQKIAKMSAYPIYPISWAVK